MRRIGLPARLPHQIRLFRSRKSRRLLIAGVGAGKTQGLVYLALKAAIEQPGVPGGLFAPTYRLFQRVVLQKWRELVPSEIYSFRAGEQLIRMVNGTPIYCLGLDRAVERVVGMNLGWAIVDEASVPRDARVPRLIMQRIRAGDPSLRFVAMVTSPRGHGWLSEWAGQIGPDGRPIVDVIRATTYDNPHLSPEYLADLEADYPRGTQEHDQELLGRIVALTGLVYGRYFSRETHVVSARYQWGRPYELGWDPGSRASGVVALQETTPGVWVVVREWLPENEFTEDTARRVWSDMGEQSPARVCIDTPSRLNTRAGVSDIHALRAIFGSACRVKVIAGRKRGTQYRRRAVSSALRGRRLLVSADLVPARMRPGERGLVHALEHLEWAEETKRDERVSEKTPLKHVTDGLEFWCADRLPPRFCDSEDRARASEQYQEGVA